MLLDYLDRVRAKPAAARERFVLIWSVVITGAIVLVWLSVLFGGAATHSEQATAERNTPSLTSSLLEGFKQNVASLRGEAALEEDAMQESKPTPSHSDLPALQNTWSATDRQIEQTQTPATTSTTVTPTPEPNPETPAAPPTAPRPDDAFITTIMNEVATDTPHMQE